MPESKVAEFGLWLRNMSWDEVYNSSDINYKTNYFQQKLLEKYHEIFPLITFRVCEEDKPWFTKSLKNLDRKRKREYRKHQKLEKWRNLNDQFTDQVKSEKVKYRERIVDDLCTSIPGQWYSRIKKMTGMSTLQSSDSSVEELNTVST